MVYVIAIIGVFTGVHSLISKKSSLNKRKQGLLTIIGSIVLLMAVLLLFADRQ